MTTEDKDYYSAPIIPITISNYAKILLLAYKSAMFTIKGVTIMIVFASPMCWFLTLQFPLKTAVLVTISAILLFMIFIPFAVISLYYVIACINPKKAMRKYGKLKDFKIN